MAAKNAVQNSGKESETKSGGIEVGDRVRFRHGDETSRTARVVSAPENGWMMVNTGSGKEACAVSAVQRVY